MTTRRDPEVDTLNAWANPHGPRTLKARRCSECKATVMAGMNGDRCAIIEMLDPCPLRETGEALAVIAGRRTCVVRRRNGRLEATRRDWLDLHFNASTNGDVWPTHECGAEPLPTIATRLDAPARVIDPDACPF